MLDASATAPPVPLVRSGTLGSDSMAAGRSTPLAREKAPSRTDHDAVVESTTSLTHTSPLRRSTSSEVELRASMPMEAESSASAITAHVGTRQGDDAEHSITNFAADTDHTVSTSITSEALANEHPRVLNRDAAQVPPVQRKWRWRLGRWLQNSAEAEEEEDDFTRTIKAAYDVDNSDVTRRALALFDTGSRTDCVSLSFLKSAWKEDWSQRPTNTIGETIHGVSVESYGQIELRWSCKHLRGKLNFKSKTYKGIFEVVDADNFDIIIGRQSINRHELLQLKKGLFGVIGARPAIRAPTNINAAEDRANGRRSAAEIRRQRIEAQEAQAANNTTSTSTNATPNTATDSGR